MFRSKDYLKLFERDVIQNASKSWVNQHKVLTLIVFWLLLLWPLIWLGPLKLNVWGGIVSGVITFAGLAVIWLSEHEKYRLLDEYMDKLPRK